MIRVPGTGNIRDDSSLQAISITFFEEIKGRVDAITAAFLFQNMKKEAKLLDGRIIDDTEPPIRHWPDAHLRTAVSALPVSFSDEKN